MWLLIFYDFKCEKCKIIWEKHYSTIGNKPRKKIKCPKCEKWAERYYSADSCPSIKIPGTKHKVVRSDVEKIYTEAIDDSKLRLSKEQQMKYSPYKSYKPNIDYMVKNGMARRCNTTRLSQKLEAAKRITAEVYEKAKVDLKKSKRRTNDD